MAKKLAVIDACVRHGLCRRGWRGEEDRSVGYFGSKGFIRVVFPPR